MTKLQLPPSLLVLLVAGCTPEPSTIELRPQEVDVRVEAPTAVASADAVPSDGATPPESAANAPEPPEPASAGPAETGRKQEPKPGASP